jgi:mycothiol synthase
MKGRNGRTGVTSAVWAGEPKLPDGADRVILSDVRSLSNFIVNDDGRDSAALLARPARPDELHEGLAMILGNDSPAAPDQVLDFLQFATDRKINLQGLWVLERAGRPQWAALPIVSPGHTALLFAPPMRPKGVDVGPLIDAVCDLLAGQNVHLVQSLLDPVDRVGRELYGSHQFREMAELLYLHAQVARALPAVNLPSGFWWRNYSDPLRPLFEQVIQESYQQSLDCPALNGMRTIGDVVAGHQASGEFDPRFWFLLSEGDTPRAVVMLSRVPRTDMAELVYLGLAPPARGRGISDLMMRQAFHAVRVMNLTRLTLAVDSKNIPALRLYYRHGMQRVGSKIAMMRDLRTM